MTACSLPVAPAVRASQQPNPDGTQAAFFVETEIARPTRTPTLASTLPPPASPTAIQVANETLVGSATPGGSSIVVTPRPGLEIYTNPDIPDYVFQVDPARWEKDPSGQTDNLHHKTISGCRVESVLGHGLGPPKRLIWQDLGRFRWEIYDYGSNAYVVPILGGVGDQGSSFVQLQGYSTPACRADQEAVLTNLMPGAEAAGQIPPTLFLSPTPRQAVDGFSCPNTPPARERVGDQIAVITDGLWLRSAPQADESSKIRKFLRYPPVMMQVIGGPVCEKFVYWQVEISTIGEASETSQGWLAEGDAQEYYLMPVK